MFVMFLPVFPMRVGMNRVFPMRVGMNLRNSRIFRIRDRVPHACGDEPLYVFFDARNLSCSPCVWG